jgi:hypothetical protein
LPPAKALLKTDSMAPISGRLPGSEARRAVEGSSFRTRNAEGMLGAEGILGAVWPPITLYRPFSIRELPRRRWSDEGPESIKTLGRLDGDLRFHMHQYHSPSGQKNDSSLWVLRLAASCPPLQKAYRTSVKYADILGHPGAEEPFDNQNAEEGET